MVLSGGEFELEIRNWMPRDAGDGKNWAGSAILPHFMIPGLGFFFDKITASELALSWMNYLEFILPKECKIE
jgi:hypothetical protein